MQAFDQILTFPMRQTATDHLPSTYRALHIVSIDPAQPEALQLLGELSDTLAAITGSSGNASFDPEDVRGPLSCFVVARSDAGIAIGCGAFRPLQDGIAEVKRMYARPGNPGTGSAILAYLEAEAKQLGYRALWLETRLINEHAVGFYESRGYTRIANFGKYADNALAVCFEKRLYPD